MENPNNRIIAVGRLEGGLELSHEVMNEPFYTGTLLVKRLSGATDRLPVTIPGKLMGMLPEDRERALEMAHSSLKTIRRARMEARIARIKEEINTADPERKAELYEQMTVILSELDD